MRKAILFLFLAAATGPLHAESVEGRVFCLDDDLTVSVILTDRDDLGPYPIADGRYRVELPQGVREGMLVFHRFGVNPSEVFANRSRPVSEFEGYYWNNRFQMPTGSDHLVLPDVELAIVTFDVRVPRSAPLQVALFRDGWKHYGSRITTFPEEYRIAYLVRPGAVVQLRLLYERNPGLDAAALVSDMVHVSRWDAAYHATVPARSGE